MSLSAVNIITYEFHNELNPAIWEDKKLKLLVKDKLLEIAQAFMEYLDIEIDVDDIVITGSLANYNYTKYSDIDLHIITDFNEYKIDTELLRDYFNAKRTVWNTTHNITIKGYTVEIYIQNTAEIHYSTGIYSLKNNEWVKEPVATKEKKDIDIEQVRNKKQTMLEIIEFALSPNCSIEAAENAKDKFLKLRKAGLEKAGDLSPENLAFKELRRSGDIEKLIKGVLAKRSRALSLDGNKNTQKEGMDPFKNFMTIGTKRGPRHQQLGAGMNKIGTGDAAGSISMVAQMHKRTDPVKIHNLKKQEQGFTPLDPYKAQEIISRYNLDVNKIKTGHPRQLSTSGIELGFNQQTNTFYLRKY